MVCCRLINRNRKGPNFSLLNGDSRVSARAAAAGRRRRPPPSSAVDSPAHQCLPLVRGLAQWSPSSRRSLRRSQNHRPHLLGAVSVVASTSTRASFPPRRSCPRRSHDCHVSPVALVRARRRAWRCPLTEPNPSRSRGSSWPGIIRRSSKAPCAPRRVLAASGSSLRTS